MSLKLATATEIARIAFSEGEARGVTVMSVVVTDAGGHIRLAMRSDSQGIFGVETATGKARTALGFNRATLQLSKVFVDPVGVAAINGATGGAFMPLGGGVVVQDGAGNTIGAAAVSGGLPDVDDAIIAAAVEAVGLTVLR